ncbi:MAG: tyrosine--tRNA ligase [Clostridiales bacterium]|nr:tyrosine--tRNA ligase [Clostridiales bacterium]
MINAYDVLKERGLIRQCSHEEELRELLGREKITFYIGFDPTADSLHVGSYVALMTMAHMQRCGHRPIALLGNGTAMIADPSGKTELRSLLSTQELDSNAAAFRVQMERVLDFSEGGATFVRNGDWLRTLNFMDFMREYAVHFSVNRMLSAECYKSRLESGSGLTFFEMSYMLMQSYDFLHLFETHNCVLQMGGDDQWSNILAGADLIRKKLRKPAFALTTALLETSDGKKMGKTERGAVWLDKNKCAPFDFYQYWRNVEDAKVESCLAMLTFLPMDEVKRLGALEGSEINEAKKILAFTLTEQVHGTEEALRAKEAAEALFGGSGDSENMPVLALTPAQAEETGLRAVDLLVLSGLCKSKGDARRQIEAGAVRVGDRKIAAFDVVLSRGELEAGGVILQKGKKSFCKVRV